MEFQKRKRRFINDAIDKMFNLAGHRVSHQDFKRKTIYAHKNYIISEYQQTEFERWFINRILQEKIVVDKKEAQNELSWFILQYGLKVVQDEYSEVETKTF